MADERPRANLGFSDELESLDPDSWTPGPTRPVPQPQERQRTRQTAEALGFRSRETGQEAAGQGRETPAATPVRRRRTGRNQQFNLKARRETIEAYCRIADAEGWGLGEALEHAVALLEERYGKS